MINYTDSEQKYVSKPCFFIYFFHDILLEKRTNNEAEWNEYV